MRKHVVLLKWTLNSATKWTDNVKVFENFACREFVNDWKYEKFTPVSVWNRLARKKENVRRKKTLKDRVKRQIFHIPMLLHRPMSTGNASPYICRSIASACRFLSSSPFENETFQMNYCVFCIPSQKKVMFSTRRTKATNFIFISKTINT